MKFGGDLMFSGIVEHEGEIRSIKANGNSRIVQIYCGDLENLEPGESICVDGICLTVTKPQEHLFCCDISPETCRVTHAGQFREGDKVNLERSLRIGFRNGGHFVMGHVDQTCHLKYKKSHNEFIQLEFTGVLNSHRPYLLKKGSVAVNGVSLTINEVADEGFQVMLVPHTLEQTNLKELRKGDAVNVEFDWMSKIIVNQVNSHMGQMKES